MFRLRALHVKHEVRLRRYCDLLAAAHLSVTSVPPAELWERHVLDSLTALEVIGDPPAAMLDVGSGGGSPGIPLALELDVPVTLLEATGGKARFLAEAAAALELPATVVHMRSEAYGRGAGRDAHDLALARALAPAPAAVELCLPLIAPGGRLLLWTGLLNGAELEPVARLLAGRVSSVQPTSTGRQLVVVEKLGPTPQRFPRRAGVARKRPLVSLRSGT